MASNLPPGVTEADIDRHFGAEPGGPPEAEVTLTLDRDDAETVIEALDLKISREAIAPSSAQFVRDQIIDELPAGWGIS